MHPLTRLLFPDECKHIEKNYGHDKEYVKDLIITDYLKQRAEWLKKEYTIPRLSTYDIKIDQAFDLTPSPKEEECSCGALNCGHTKPIPSQPRPEIPKKILLGWLDCRSGENNDLYLAKIINQLISCVEELRKDK